MIANGLSKNSIANGRQSLFGGSIYFGCQAGTTPYGRGDHITIFGKDGLTAALKAGPEYEVVAENQLWASDDTFADPDLTPETEGQRQRSAAMFGGRSLYGYAAIPGFLLIHTGDHLHGPRKE